MYLNFKNEQTYIATGGLDLDKEKITLCFVHGAGQNHFSFTQQVRYFTSQGYNVIAPDFPGHGFSKGKHTISIEEDVKWLADLLKFLKLEKIVFIGHSQACLTCIEMYKIYPNFISGLIFIAGALKIPVNQFLIDMSIENPEKAYDFMVTWGQGDYGSFSISDWPGHQHLNEGREIMKLNDPKVLTTDLKSCNSYKDGKIIASKIDIKCLAVLAKFDAMTPITNGLEFEKNIKDCKSVSLECGHFLPIEKPKQLNSIIKQYLESIK